MTVTLTGRAATDRAARWNKQLASHLGRKIDTELGADGVATVHMADATAVLTPTATTLELAFSGPTETHLMRLAGVVVSHFERFGEKDGITVEWDDPDVAAEYARREAAARSERAREEAAGAN